MHRIYLHKTAKYVNINDTTALHCIQGKITFDNVKFHYNGTEALFQNKSIEIKAGQKVGLVGYSGGGKSTFVNLILRLYDVTDGAILVVTQAHDMIRALESRMLSTVSDEHKTLLEKLLLECFNNLQ